MAGLLAGASETTRVAASNGDDVVVEAADVRSKRAGQGPLRQADDRNWRESTPRPAVDALLVKISDADVLHGFKIRDAEEAFSIQ